MVPRHAGKLALWALLAVPAALILHEHWTSPDLWPGDFLPATGEWSARLIIAALMLTPLQQLLPRSSAVRWLVRHRRAIGVAAFAYALLHLAFYVLDMETLANMLAELGAPSIWTGWLALLCLLPPALTSNDAAVRALRGAWKRLQRLAHPAAVLTLIHWVLVHDGMVEAILHFLPLALLQIARLARIFTLIPAERKIA
ncbi:MAG TPA: ferric reductase-like transmembrane domain-containing protein [Noviherbaspirillum sp.]|jgi:methionine sulfoxide reductase heme-binding subunit|nr:ferric reductase-like transmembrane domain-containing protein [Noviherbaspirillum sp.]